MKCFAAGTLRVSALCPASLQQPPGSQCVCSKVLHPSLARKKNRRKNKSFKQERVPQRNSSPSPALLHSPSLGLSGAVGFVAAGGGGRFVGAPC